MPRDPLPRAAGGLAAHPAPWLVRLARELASRTERPDPFVRLIIVERLAKATALVIAGASLILLRRLGLMQELAEQAQTQLNLGVGRGLFSLLLERLSAFASYSHQVALALGAFLYAGLELAEGLGLALRRRWAEYLTVLATSFFLPFELAAVLRHATPLRVGALLLNAAVVVYLAWRKRLFVGV